MKVMKRKINEQAYQLVRDKRAWEGPREPAEAAVEEAIGSRGWYTRGYLPHCDKPGTMQMVTFRLADAMPAGLRPEWAALLAIEDAREQRTKLEEYLDRGHGECFLADARVAAAVEEVFLRYDAQRYRMTAWVVMPNHVHVLFELWDMPLGKLLKAWKGTSANAANHVLGRTGTFWQEEYWDRYMRDEAHFRKAQHYIEWNPVKAHLVKEPEAWRFGSANPQWRWSAADRYLSGGLLNGPAVAVSRAGGRRTGMSALLNVGAPRDELERGHSCPPVAREATEADRNVGAPKAFKV